MKRIFAAIKINTTNDFENFYEKLRDKLKHDKITWVKPENIHITLKFFGEVEEQLIPTINDLLQNIAWQYPPFELAISNIGVFGSRYQPRVIWFGIAPNETLTALGNNILTGVESLGFKRERQNFVPHLTVGRVKSIKDKKFFWEIIEQLKEAELLQQHIEKFSLFESKLYSHGLEYGEIASFTLKGS